MEINQASRTKKIPIPTNYFFEISNSFIHNILDPIVYVQRRIFISNSLTQPCDRFEYNTIPLLRLEEKETMKNLLSPLAFIVLLAIGISSCKSTKDAVVSTDRAFGIAAVDCIDIPAEDPIDSQVGRFECDGLSISYDYGRYSNPGPITPKEEFRRSFDTYHHIKFFEDRMIDPKVYKIFLDSVQVEEVREKSPKDKLMFDCDPCNTVAALTFMGEQYLYPVTFSQKQLDDKGVTLEERGAFTHKYFIDREGRQAAYITPTKNRFKKKNTLRLTVQESSLAPKEVLRILKSAYIAEPTLNLE